MYTQVTDQSASHTCTMWSRRLTQRILDPSKLSEMPR